MAGVGASICRVAKDWLTYAAVPVEEDGKDEGDAEAYNGDDAGDDDEVYEEEDEEDLGEDEDDDDDDDEVYEEDDGEEEDEEDEEDYDEEADAEARKEYENWVGDKIVKGDTADNDEDDGGEYDPEAAGDDDAVPAAEQGTKRKAEEGVEGDDEGEAKKVKAAA